jgi:hypothetical protein
MLYQQRNTFNPSSWHHERHWSTFESLRQKAVAELLHYVITEQEAITTTFCHQHTASKPFSK